MVAESIPFPITVTGSGEIVNTDNTGACGERKRERKLAKLPMEAVNYFAQNKKLQGRNHKIVGKNS